MENNKKIYTVILGDLIDSRKVEDPSGFMKIAEKTYEHINRKYREEFFAPLTISHGIDEVIAVLKKPACAYMICSEINTLFSPRKMRFAIVRNNVIANDNIIDPHFMTGTAFHIASEKLRTARKKCLPYCFMINKDSEEINQLLDHTAELIDIIESGRSHRQNEIINAYTQNNNQNDVADRFSISQQAVSEILKTSKLVNCRNAKDAINKILQKA